MFLYPYLGDRRKTLKYIANILTEEPFTGDTLYNVVSERESLVDGIPVLIIGWDITKELYPDASIIEWQVADNVYWTYGKYERREKYEENIKRFQKMALDNLRSTISYTFFDTLTESTARVDQFITFISNPGVHKTVYLSNNMLYIFQEGFMKVIGVSLRDCEYLSETYKKRVFSAIYSNKEGVKILKTDEIPGNLKYMMKGQEYIFPYLFS